MSDCIFCKIITRQIPTTIVAENDDIIVINDIAPKAPIHFLIIPKKHVVDIQNFKREDLFFGAKMFEMAQQLAKEKNTDFRFIINSGKKAGQKVFHIHGHFLAGKEMHD